MIAAATPGDALGSRARQILLLTDVVMPGWAGRQLSERFACQQHPGPPVLFMSGWSASAGVPLPGAVLEKPFTPAQLLTGVKALLEA